MDRKSDSFFIKEISIRNVEEIITYLESSSFKCEAWVTIAVQEIFKIHRSLREDIQIDGESWSYFDYCIRLSYHFYNLASYYYYLYYNYKIDLKNVEKYLEKCIQKLNEAFVDYYDEEHLELLKDAKSMKEKIDMIFNEELAKCQMSITSEYVTICISLGNIFNDNLNFGNIYKRSDVVLNQIIDNILFLRTIDILENCLSIPLCKSHLILAERCMYLSTLYKLGNCHEESKNYTYNANLILKELSFSDKKTDNNFIKQNIKITIKQQIKEYFKPLEEVNHIIEKENPLVTFNSVEYAYIQRKYLKYCSIFWLEDTEKYMHSLIETKNLILIKNIFENIHNTKNINDIAVPLNELDSYKLLIQNIKLIKQKNQQIYFDNFRKACIKQITAFCCFANQELIFIEAFVEFLNSFKVHKIIISKLKLDLYCNNSVTFESLAESINNLDPNDYGESLKNLQDSLKSLNGFELFMDKTFKDILKLYLKSVQINKKYVDGRTILEVSGKSILLSDIIFQLQNELLANQDVEEIRFVEAEIIHIDKDFSKNIWHGKNIVVYAKKLKIYGKINWDISGLDMNMNNEFDADVRRDSEGNGLDGVDGSAGESGGNVLIITDEIDHPTNLTIISNGGHGSKGQDGGRGKDGENGKGLSKFEFLEKMPIFTRCFTDMLNVSTHIKKNIEFIRSCTVNVDWESDPVTGYAGFFNAYTAENNEITMFFDTGIIHRRCFQGLCLYKGSYGKIGKKGGAYGFGGQGGYGGEIFNNSKMVCFESIDGKLGENGKAGEFGNYGKNGSDIGYMDYQIWREAKFEGEYKDKKISIQYVEKSNSDNVYCHYRNVHLGKSDYYAMFKTSDNNKRIKKFEERAEEREKVELQHQAKATKKKNISEANIRSQYTLNSEFQEKNLLQNIKSDIDSTLEKALNTVFEYHEQEQQHLTELNIKRNVFHSGSNKHIISIVEETTFTNTFSANENNKIFNNIINHPFDFSSYLKLNSIELLDGNIDQIYSIFEENKLIIPKKHHKEINNILTDKYRFTILQELSHILPVYEENKEPRKITAEMSSRYLTESKTKSYEISHPILGYISSYLFVNNEKNRNDIITFCKNVNSDDDEWPAIKKSLILFILEQEKKYEVSNIIKAYIDDYQQFTNENNKKLNNILYELGNTLRRNEYVYYLWCQSFKDNSFKEKFAKEISTDKLISALYTLFKHYHNNKYDWQKCISEAEVLKEYYNIISEYGTNLSSYLELLSHVYKINIRVYTEIKGRGFVLINNHNKDSKDIIYLLRRGDTIVNLDFNVEYLNLEEHYKIKNELYYKIIEHAFIGDSKSEIKTYFEECKESILNQDKLHPILKELEPYLFLDGMNQRTAVSKYVKENLSLMDRALHKSIKMFILEEGKHEINNYENKYQDAVKLHYKNYINFLQQQKQYLFDLLEPMKYEIMKHVNIFTDKDKRERKIKLEKEFEKDLLFKNIYNKFSERLELNYSWLENWPELFGQFKKKLEYGALEPCYRELLSFMYNINIRVYSRDLKHKQFNLLYDHNPFSNKIIIVEQTKEKLINIKEDENFILQYYKVFSNIQNIISIFDLKEFDENLEVIFDGILLEKDNMTNPKLTKEDDDDTVNEIISFFKTQDDSITKNCLQKLSADYIGESNLLRHLLKRFKCEGLHVDSEVLCQFVNLIFNFIIEDKNYLNIFNWIILTVPQSEWISEIILIQLENYFRKKLSKKEIWRKYLSKTQNRDALILISIKLNNQQQIITMQCIDEILYLLSNIPLCTIKLNLIDLSMWSYALKEKYWETKLKNLLIWNNNEYLYTATYYIMFLENMYGHDLIENFIKTISKKSDQFNPAILIEIFSNLNNEKWNLSESEVDLLSKLNVKEWISQMNTIFSVGTERNVSSLIRLIKSNANTSEHVKELLENIEENVKLCDRSITHVESTSTKEDIQSWSRNFKTNYVSNAKEPLKYEILLSVINQAIYITRGFYLRDMQTLTIMSYLTNQQNTLAQVSTGEGKSLIIVSLAIIKCLIGEKVDIITSSSVLAKRDVEIYRDIYTMFEINVSHNCHEDIEKRKEAYSCNQVVYGDLANFQRDYLLDRFYRKNVLGDRDFYNAIIDEVDCMLLDRGNNTLYLSHDLKGLDKLESIYLYIWQSMNKPTANLHASVMCTCKNTIKNAILHDIFGTILKKDLQTISNKLDEETLGILYNRIIKFKLIDREGKLLISDISDINIDEILSTDYNSFKEEFVFLIKETIEREKRIPIPNYLKDFVLRHLDSWINSAEKALYLKEGRDYVLDIDRTGTSPNMNPIITILDVDTGTDQANSEWDEALHQFLQLKHGCKLSLQSLKAVFISNVSYFKLYKNLYGLTGTLGSKSERQLLKKIHNVHFVTIPTAKPKKFIEYNPILCATVEDLTCTILNQAKMIAEQKNRSVLIICETLNEVENLYKLFGGKEAKNVYTYIRDYEEFDVANGIKKLSSGMIIIATNLAGRGTDIILSEELKQAGGLHVCLTYLPKNSRIEQQAFGRAARCGEMGSGQLIILSNVGKLYSRTQLLFLKTNRDVEEARRISEIETIYNNQIQAEEKCFVKFKEQYDILKEKLVSDKIPKDIADILLQSCLNNWAYWLDENSKLISNFKSIESRKQVESLFQEFANNMKTLNTENSGFRKWIDYIFTVFVPTCKGSYEKASCETGWIQDPIELTNLGKCLAKHKFFKEAIKIYDIVISREPKFSEAAHYYKAYSLAKTFSCEQDLSSQQLIEFKTELKQSAKLFRSHCEFSTVAAGIIGTIKQNTYNNIIQINAYEEQKKAINDYYSLFLQSIDEILGSPIYPQNFVSNDINEDFAETIYDDLLNEEILNKMEINNDLSPDIIQNLAYNYGLTSINLKSFLSSYNGQQINEKEFQKSLKQHIKLPNREDFWKILKCNGMWEEEIIYVVIDKNRLKYVNPSLLNLINRMISRNKIEEEHFQSNSKANIYLYTPVELQQLNKNIIVIKKKEFIQLLKDNNLKYKSLKTKGIFSKNKRAATCVNLQTITLPIYDSIKAEDFIKENITANVANKILDELVKTEILKIVNDTYRLNITYDKLSEVKLKSFPIYENSVHTLLHFCFNYRIALQKLEEQMKRDQNQNPVGIKLISKPYTNLMMEMIDLQVIKQREMKNKHGELNEKIKKLYNTKMDKNKLKHILTRHNIIENATVNKDLIKELEKKGWIKLTSNINYVTITENTKLPLRKFRHVEHTLRLIFRNMSDVSQTHSVQRIANLVEDAIGTLLTLDTPDAYLEQINDNNLHNHNINVQEVHVFFLNCLDELLKFKEKKWTAKMCSAVLSVVVIGIIQIIIGNLLELYSISIVAGDTAAFISEGINDIKYALYALYSGYFSWKDYGKYKLNNIKTSVLNDVLSASTVIKVYKSFRIANKVIGSTAEKTVGEMTENKLSSIFTEKIILKNIGNRIACKTIEGLAIGAANVGIDIFMENCIEKFCASIATTIFLNIEKEVEGHSISRTLESIYKYLGLEKSKDLVNTETDKYFKQTMIKEKFVPITSNIVSSFRESITQNLNINSTLNEQKSQIDEIIRTVTQSSTFCATEIKNLTSTILNDLNQQLQEKLDKIVKDRNLQPDISLDEKYDIMKIEIVTKWKLQLKDKASHVINKNIVKPLLKDGKNYLIRLSKKLIQKCSNDYIESGYKRQFEERKQEFLNEPEETKEETEHKTHLNVIKERNHEDLIKIMQKTKNPQLFADIINENIPMDMTCITGWTHIIHKLLKSIGINGIKIIITNESGFQQTIPTVSDNKEEVVVNLTLKNNRFTFTGNPLQGDKNCLFDTLKQQVPVLNNMTTKMFWHKINSLIKNSTTLYNIIKSDWNRFSISYVTTENIELKELINTNKMNMDIENDPNNPNNGYTGPGSHIYDPKKDVDLRKNETLSFIELHEQRTEGHIRALEKIKERVAEIQKGISNPVTVSESNFKTILSNPFLIRTNLGNVEVGLYILEKKAMLEVKTKINNKIENVTLTAEIIMNNSDSSVKHVPKGPHIGWSVSGFGATAEGYVFLNRIGNEFIPRREKISPYMTEFKDRHIPLTTMLYPQNRLDVIANRTGVLHTDHTSKQNIINKLEKIIFTKD